MGGFRRVLLRKPSAALVVAGIALLVALAAPGYAAVQSVFFAQTAGNAKRVDGLKASGKPHPNELLALNSHGKFPASVGAIGPQGVQGPHGLHGPQGPQGNPGVAGAAGSAIAYGTLIYEQPDGGGPVTWRVDDGLSKGLDNDANLGDAGHPVAGVFCFHGLPFAVLNVIATPGAFGSSGPFLVQGDTPHAGHSVNSNCPPNTGAAIYITDMSGKLTDPPDPSDTIYFTFN
jgi:hypothetical protein